MTRLFDCPTEDGVMRVLDLFCGAGGATRGYVDAGHEVYGVDLHYQPSYRPGSGAPTSPSATR